MSVGSASFPSPIPLPYVLYLYTVRFISWLYLNLLKLSGFFTYHQV